jgi:hypothetical protein
MSVTIAQNPLYSQVALTQDLPEHHLKKGAIATIVEHYPMPDTEDGYSLEGFDVPNVTIEVSASQIVPIVYDRPEVIEPPQPVANITTKLSLLSPTRLTQLNEYLDFLLYKEQAKQVQTKSSNH